MFTAESGVMTIVFTADLFATPGNGFVAHWECATDCSAVTPCSATIYDPQVNSNYLPNQHIVTTYCPDGPNKRIKVEFSLFGLASGDTLKVYDGNSTAAPLLQNLTGFNNFAYHALATNANTQGCLTLAFSSDSAGEDVGYIGKLTCQRACQTITPSILTNATVPTYPTVAGDSAVNICAGQFVTLTAQAIYPQNDSIYHQTDSTTHFEPAELTGCR